MATRKERRTDLRNFLGEGDLNKGRRQTFLTTGAGSASGNTVISTNAVGVDDSVIGAYLRPEDGDAQGQEKLIIDFEDSTGTYTVAPAFGVQIDTALTINQFERGRYSDIELERALQQAEYKIAQSLPTESLYFLQKHITCAVDSGVIRRDTLLSDMVQMTMFTDVERNKIFRLLPPTELQNVKNSQHPDFATTDRAVAIQLGNIANGSFGDFWILPSDITTVDAHYIKAPTDFTVSNATETTVSEIDDTFGRLVTIYAAFIVTGDGNQLQAFNVEINTIRNNLGLPPLGFEGEQPLEPPELNRR